MQWEYPEIIGLKGFKDNIQGEELLVIPPNVRSLQ